MRIETTADGSLRYFGATWVNAQDLPKYPRELFPDTLTELRTPEDQMSLVGDDMARLINVLGVDRAQSILGAIAGANVVEGVNNAT
jgi:hypothetical protein